MGERTDGLPPAADQRNIVDDSHPVLKGRIAGWALEGEVVLGLCPVHGGFGPNVGQHIPGLIKMCADCAAKQRAAQGVAPGNPLNV